MAFIHQQKANAASATGGRRAVAIADLATGNAETGKRYFDDACSTCHSVTGDLAGIGTRLQGLELLRRMLYPGSEGGGCCTSGGANERTVTVTTRAGQAVTGTLVYRDEFFIALTDRSGWYRSWPTNQVDFRVVFQSTQTKYLLHQNLMAYQEHLLLLPNLPHLHLLYSL